eukprot:UN28896
MGGVRKRTNDVYVGLYLKSKFDGKPRSGRPIDLAIVLDKSGSMDFRVGESFKTRMQLAVSGIKKLLTQLGPGDSVSIAVFDTRSYPLLTQTKIRNLRYKEVCGLLDRITARGGTTVSAGMDCGSTLLSLLPSDPNRERRILFLTDMLIGEWYAGQLKEKMDNAANCSIYTSVIDR